MAFRFSLAAVLKLRESVEQREHFKLLKIQLEITELSAEIRRTEESQSAAEAGRKTELAQGMPAGHLRDSYERARLCTQMRETLKSRLKEAEIRQQQQLKSYRIARQGREVLEKLREQQFSEYVRIRDKRQQALVDDLFLAHFKRDD